MSKSGNRRSNGPAVLRFFIYLLIIIIVSTLAVLFLGLGKNSGERPYVATGTVEPGAYVAVPTPAPTANPTPASGLIATEEPTAEPTEEPTAEPTPVITPTPVPTRIPEEVLSLKRADFKLPKTADDGNVGISSCYVSAADNYGIMELTGWGYADLDYFDGEQCGIYLIVTQESTSRALAYLTVCQEGISGIDHSGAKCKNAAACDWRAYIDVSGYEPGIYSLSLVLCYKNGAEDEYRHYAFGPLQSFTVKDGEVITPVTVTGIE